MLARSAKKILSLNTQVKHENGQKKNILTSMFARSAKKNFTLNTHVKHESGQKKNILT